MSQPPPAPPSLDELRKEIDAIDAQVHSLLMARGDIIDRLIQVKQTQEVGSAFRPAREASMMRQLVQRHRGILPIDTIESIWRVIISTFTYVQAPFSVHADVSIGESAMRDSARFHFGFVVPYVAHFSAQAAVEAVAKSKGDLALVSATSSRTPWWIALEADGAPKIIARWPFLERADHPAALPVFVVSRVADSAMVTEVEMWSVRVSGWNAEIARALSPLAEIVAVPDTAFDGAALLVSVAAASTSSLEKIRSALIEDGASVRSSAATQSAIWCPRTGRNPDSRPIIRSQKMSRPVPNPGILEIAPYTPGKSPVPEPGRKVFKLSANETPFGPSPKALAAYREAAAHLEDYPEGTSRVLREAIGRAFGLDPDRIICGAGSDEILNLLAHTYLGHGDEAISTTHGFLVYPIATMANGAINVIAPETDFTADVDAILKRVSPRTKLVWLANPNNPTGTYLPFDEVKRLRAGLPPHVLLVLDAAYSDYVSRNDYEFGIDQAATTENTVMTHTFSKIHGLASLRIGWMFAPAHIVDAVNRIRGPFNVSTPAMLAAVAAIEDTAHVQMSKAHTEKWRNRLTEEVTKLGLNVTPSVANFILIHFPLEKGKTAADADAFLTRRGLVLRGLNNYGLPHALRMTIGTEEANRLVVEGLRDFTARQ